MEKQSGCEGRGQQVMPPVLSWVTGESEISWSKYWPNCISMWVKLPFTSSCWWIVPDSNRAFGSRFPDLATRGFEIPAKNGQRMLSTLEDTYHQHRQDQANEWYIQMICPNEDCASCCSCHRRYETEIGYRKWEVCKTVSSNVDEELCDALECGPSHEYCLNWDWNYSKICVSNTAFSCIL